MQRLTQKINPVKKKAQDPLPPSSQPGEAQMQRLTQRPALSPATLLPMRRPAFEDWQEARKTSISTWRSLDDGDQRAEIGSSLAKLILTRRSSDAKTGRKPGKHSFWHREAYTWRPVFGARHEPGENNQTDRLGTEPEENQLEPGRRRPNPAHSPTAQRTFKGQKHGKNPDVARSHRSRLSGDENPANIPTWHAVNIAQPTFRG